MNKSFKFQGKLLLSVAAAPLAMVPIQAHAQEGSTSTGGLGEIVVTAQKREQSLQDVPIAVTAVTQENLQANRIFTVNDLSSIAPGLTVKPSAGGISTPAFTMRGQVSFGVVAGSDKQVSIYVDGVYISSPRGSIFQLPDIERLEVLRGPQGTLFGRNATAGAVSITTRDPSGEVGFKVQGSVGNLDAYRLRATLDTPEFGPFSAYFSYVRDYRRGDIENAGAGTVWDRTLSSSPFGVRTSPRWLGTVNSHSYFAAVKFEPAGSDFKTVYKYDRNDDKGTPEGTGFIGVNPAAPLTGAITTALVNSQEVYAAPNGKRPKIVTNSWVTPRRQHVQGHSVTSTWQATDNLTVKNVFGYRKAEVFAPSSIDGLSGLVFTPEALVPTATLFGISALAAQGVDLTDPANGPLIQGTIGAIAGSLAPQLGNRFLLIASQASSISKQYSDELIVNYASGNLNATVGALWFHSSDQSGGPVGIQNTFSLSILPQSGVIPLGNVGRYFNKATSLAAYAQLEYKFSPQLEVIAGARITKDKKTSRFVWDVLDPGTGTIFPQPTIVPPPNKKTKPNFLVGVNWTPNDDVLVYGKWSNSFVSGGSTAGIEYDPETASSFELGLKADFLNRRLRTNLAVYHVTYKNYQSPQSTTSPQSTAAILPILTDLYGAASAARLPRSLSTFVISQGTIKAKGFELEVTAAPTDGLNLGGSLGYTDVKNSFIDPLLLAANGGELVPTARPKWTAAVFGSYETQPIFGDSTLQFRVDGQFRSRTRFNSHPTTDLYTEGLSVATVKGFWLVNGRAAVRHISIGGANAELAVWGKNVFNRKEATFALFTPLADSANYLPPRTFGIELSLDF